MCHMTIIKIIFKYVLLIYIVYRSLKKRTHCARTHDIDNSLLYNTFVFDVINISSISYLLHWENNLAVVNLNFRFRLDLRMIKSKVVDFAANQYSDIQIFVKWFLRFNNSKFKFHFLPLLWPKDFLKNSNKRLHQATNPF